eukprot:6107051-Prymnesium_polylepis.1
MEKHRRAPPRAPALVGLDWKRESWGRSLTCNRCHSGAVSPRVDAVHWHRVRLGPERVEDGVALAAASKRDVCAHLRQVGWRARKPPADFTSEKGARAPTQCSPRTSRL